MTPKKKTPFAKTKKQIQFVKDLLYPLLRHEILDIEFLKANGVVRRMKCTRNPEAYEVHIPMEKFHLGFPRKKNPDVCKVWDTKKKGWRSFRFDSVISVAVV
jgi:hypothetical protein